MARIDIKTKISAPDEIEIPLVRADYKETSNIFRLFFEIFLSLFSAFIGVVCSIDKVTKLHYLLLFISFIFGLSFLILSIKYSGKSKCI